MSWLQRLFSKNSERPTKKDTHPKPKVQDWSEIENLPEIHAYIREVGRKSLLLRPQLTDKDASIEVSKFGGIPNLRNFNEYPKCPYCSTNLNFVVQVYQDDLNKIFFPKDRNLFQLFRCPNQDCSGGYEDKWDLPTKIYFFKDNELGIQLEKDPIPIGENYETEVPTCIISPSLNEDFPGYEDRMAVSKIEDVLLDKFNEEVIELMDEELCPNSATKFGGYPSWIQSSFYPSCSCGENKKFIFQLSSEDRELNESNTDWSPHKIMIGDVGNLYFFMCDACGTESIESYWDCF